MSATENPANRYNLSVGTTRPTLRMPTALVPARLRFLLPALLLLLTTPLFTGCMTLVDSEGSQEQRSDAILTLTGDSQFRQTFISRRAGLNRIELWLRLPEGDDQTAGYVSAELRHRPKDPVPIAEALFTPAQVKASAGSISLSFPPQPDF